MSPTNSQSQINRQTGKHQVDEQRTSILDAAELRFLQNGLEKTSMLDIARQAGISKVTLYRYFANHDVLALEIQVRMLNKISDMIHPVEHDLSLEGRKKMAQSMIRNFTSLRDAYRYIGMFDKIYLDNAPDTALTQWTKSQLSASHWRRPVDGEIPQTDPHGNEFAVILNTITWFLEKLALRGELTWSDQEIPLEQHLKVFEEMIMGYIDQMIGTQKNSD